MTTLTRTISSEKGYSVCVRNHPPDRLLYPGLCEDVDRLWRRYRCSELN